jgi:hypothetical protein
MERSINDFLKIKPIYETNKKTEMKILKFYF